MSEDRLAWDSILIVVNKSFQIYQPIKHFPKAQMDRNSRIRSTPSKVTEGKTYNKFPMSV